MFGKIYSSGNYADMEPRFEVSIYFEEGEVFPFSMGERYECNLKVNDEEYICGVRTTENAGSWISPDLYHTTYQREKARLSEVLIKNGFERNEGVSLIFEPESNKLRIKKTEN